MGFAYVPTRLAWALRSWPGVPINLHPHEFYLCPCAFGLGEQRSVWRLQEFGSHPQELHFLCPCAFGLPQKLDWCPQKFGYCLHRFPLGPCTGARCPCASVARPKRLNRSAQKVAFCTHGFHAYPYTFGQSPKEFDWCPQKFGLSPP